MARNAQQNPPPATRLIGGSGLSAQVEEFKIDSHGEDVRARSGIVRTETSRQLFLEAMHGISRREADSLLIFPAWFPLIDVVSALESNTGFTYSYHQHIPSDKISSQQSDASLISFTEHCPASLVPLAEHIHSWRALNGLNATKFDWSFEIAWGAVTAYILATALEQYRSTKTQLLVTLMSRARSQNNGGLTTVQPNHTTNDQFARKSLLDGLYETSSSLLPWLRKAFGTRIAYASDIDRLGPESNPFVGSLPIGLDPLTIESVVHQLESYDPLIQSPDQLFTHIQLEVRNGISRLQDTYRRQGFGNPASRNGLTHYEWLVLHDLHEWSWLEIAERAELDIKCQRSAINYVRNRAMDVAREIGIRPRKEQAGRPRGSKNRVRRY